MILSSMIDVICDGAEIDVMAPASSAPPVLPDLAAIYIDHALKIQAHGWRLRPPAGNTVSWCEQCFAPDGQPSPGLAGWNPVTRQLVVRLDLAWAPRLVSDVVAHELVHQIISDNAGNPQHAERASQEHGDLFLSIARAVAPVLGLPRPRTATIASWPQAERFEHQPGWYGPMVQPRQPIGVSA